MRRFVLLAIAATVGCAGGSDGRRATAGEIGEADEGGSDSTDSTTTATTATTTTSTPGACVPGQQIACACPGGTDGAQACLGDGSGFGPCECPTETTTTGVEPSETSQSTDEAGSDEGPVDCPSCAADAVVGGCAKQMDACGTDPECSGFVSCVLDCGFVEGCVARCTAGAPDSPGLQLFTQLTNCVVLACPVCEL